VIGSKEKALPERERFVWIVISSVDYSSAAAPEMISVSSVVICA
jgi:hypothetical protein